LLIQEPLFMPPLKAGLGSSSTQSIN